MNKTHLYKRITADFRFADDRGMLTQLVHDGYKQVNVLESKSGTLRGSHYHQKTREAFFVISGSVQVTLSNENETETIAFSSGDFFEIEPNVRHCLYFPEDCTMVQLYSTPVENEQGIKDILTDNLKGKPDAD